MIKYYFLQVLIKNLKIALTLILINFNIKIISFYIDIIIVTFINFCVEFSAETSF